MAEHNFSGALSTWRSINLSGLQKTLDAQGIELVDNQKESVIGRKLLADKTKEFKKLPDEEKVNAFKTLLKAYQTEIDNLTKRAKVSENAFLNVYKVLAEAPDPYPLLEVAVDQTVKIAEAVDLELELQRIKDENNDLRRRANEYTNIDTARKRAEEKVENLEQKMEDMLQDRISQKESELHATYDERLRNYEEREQDLQRQVSLAKQQLRDLRTSNESNQAKLMDQSQRQDQEVVAKLAELDMIVADLERANSRVAAVERRNEILRAEIESVRSGTENSDRFMAMQVQINELREEGDRATRALEAQKESFARKELTTTKHAEELAKEVQNKALELDELKERLKQYYDYDDIKRELEIMKYVEFGGLDDDVDDSESGLGLSLPNPNADKGSSDHGKSLETLLAHKNKRILEELTKFRILHSELEESLRASQDELISIKSELVKQKALNEKLETDILSMNKHRTNGDIATGVPDVHPGLEAMSKDPSSRSSPIPFTSSADISILPIVTGQRDRFRQRNAELEEELRKQFQIISDLRTEIKTLQSDNLKLYEKVRYMQSYREDGPSRPVAQLDPLPVPSGINDDMSKYRERYEETMNPFEAFRGREATRAYQNLNPVEKGVLVITRTILGNRRARTFLIFYTLALHLLVMFTTYECTVTSGTQLQKQPMRHQ